MLAILRIVLLISTDGGRDDTDANLKASRLRPRKGVPEMSLSSLVRQDAYTKRCLLFDVWGCSLQQMRG